MPAADLAAIPTLSVIIPAYDEQERLPATLAAFEPLLWQMPMEILVVCDGCTDNTEQAAAAFSDRLPIKVISYQPNRGKGYAVREGVRCATGRLISFYDADGATPAEELLRLANLLEVGGDDIVIGSRRAAGAQVKRQPLLRHLLGAFLSLFTRWMLRLPFKDTQCGCKVFRSQVAKRLFEQMRSKRFEFDIELLTRAHRQGLRIREVGIRWQDVPVSKVRLLRDGWQILKAVWYCRTLG